MISLLRSFSLVVFALLLSAGPGAANASPGMGMPPAPEAHQGMAAAGEAAVISGKVVETMNAAGYTYVCLEKSGKKTWVAVPETKVTVGKQMSFQPGQAMPNFTSKTLGRTFDSIIFSGGPVDAPAGAQASSAAASGKSTSATVKGDVRVAKAAGPGAYTIAEIYAKAGSLHKKTAVVRGTVVKVSPQIMGTNWIHLQDGTGSAEKGSNDLVVTSDELPSTGEVITVKGTIAKDKDFGAGYMFKAIMEKARIQR